MSSITGRIEGNAVIGQSGGPTAVINQSLVGCIEGLRQSKAVKRIYGARHAVAGMVKGDFVDLTDITDERLERLAVTPSSALGSSRDKPDADYCRKILASFQTHNIRYFFYIGGNDSSDTCRIVNDLAKSDGYQLRTFHIPKTIDNDLMCNDHTPGFGSAAKFVVQAMMGDNLDNKALPGVKINVIMGRHAGFLTAASVLARQHEGDGPHLIYVPEAAFDIEQFLTDVERVRSKYGRCLVAVSEGIHDADGTPIAAKLAQSVEKDSHGNVQLSGSGALGDFLSNLVKTKLGVKRVRADTFGYLQRSMAGVYSTVDAAEARAAGRKAAEVAILGDFDGSIAINRVSNDPYEVEFNMVALEEVAAKTRHLPQEYIIGGNDIDRSFRDYLAPIVGELPVIEQI